MAPTLLKKMSQAFRELADTVNQNKDMEVKPFAKACSYITDLMRHIGPLSKFAVDDFAPRVCDLEAASRSFRSLRSMMCGNIEQNNVRSPGSHTRNLLMVKRVIELVNILFQQIVATNYDDKGDNSLASQGLAAYLTVFSQYHGTGLKATVEFFKPHIPSKAQLLVKLEEIDEASCVAQMRIIAEAATRITQHIDNLFITRDLGLDWS
ncbi:hypothetical protein C5167_041137 [Papaver somniferum]|uniref:Glycolipid transfer protein domain-containing protein n=1 Tax=Papaver somniferum TaxID=3469 RepID=A0A4Y7IKD8_PAPSO|nr:accelerated cell death 11-like [Papaver somniferum]RZC48191.1 hypothetical protein C5167_041137 [Papaver somniferum]